MRIIAGKYRGKRLIAPTGRGTRPTSDKVRESIFNILSSRGLTGGKVLDLFAGTGALGIEAMSRGADSAVFVEKNPEAATVVRKNLSALGIDAKVYNTDYKVALRKLEGRQFDLIFLDPPYAQREESSLLKEISSKRLLADGGCIVLEHASDSVFDCGPFDSDRRKYSDTSVTFLTARRKRPLCIFPGTFDPFTLGHLDVVGAALRDYEKVIVAVAEITYKRDAAACNARAEIARLSLGDEPRAEVKTFEGMLTDYLISENCRDVVRGVRDETDRKYEESIAEVYKKALPDVSMVYYDAVRPAISSHEVRRLIAVGETDKLKEFVCGDALNDIIKIYGKIFTTEA